MEASRRSFAKAGLASALASALWTGFNRSAEAAHEHLAALLNSKRGVHPRLFVDSARIAELRTAIQTTHSGLWLPVKELADTMVTGVWAPSGPDLALVKPRADTTSAAGPPAYQEGRSDTDEQNWQRGVANNTVTLAFAYLMTRSKAYLDAAQKWALASCGYPHWGMGSIDKSDLAASHQLFSLGLVYDWLHGDLDPDTRATILRTVAERGPFMFRSVTKRMTFLHNHMWVDGTGLATAALAIFDEPEIGDQALAWIELAHEKFRVSEASLGPDGASHEGVAYWTYGVEYMLKFWNLSQQLLNENLSNEWWRKTAKFRLYMSLPQHAWTKQSFALNMADGPRGDYYGSDYLLRRLAAINRDGHAQWLAEALDQANVCVPAAPWLNVLWYDPTVAPETPADMPTLWHFPDLDIVSSRTDWSGDESLFVLKCGPCLGHYATARFDFDPGSGHAHPDANHFLLFGAGDWLIADDGYSWKETQNHNTLLIDEKGQIGEGRWFRGENALAVRARPRILRAAYSSELDHVVGDATDAYPRDSGLRRFVRHAIFLKPDILLIVDDIESGEPHNYELRFHPASPAEKGAAGACLCRGSKADLRIDPLTPQGVEVTAATLPAKDTAGRPFTMFTVRLQSRSVRWRNAVALSWCRSGQDPVGVRLETIGDLWLFTAGARRVQFNWDGRPPKLAV